LTSSYERSDRVVLEELEQLLAAVEQELGSWRARCQRAEAELALTTGKGKGGHGGPDLSQARLRIGALEGENDDLKRRIAAAREHVERLRTRLRFVEEHGAGDAA
jgi:predicted  nucleic acid-binding Zn-ribbon protein